MTADPRITLALTGASGMPYALTLLRALLEREQQVLLLLSDAAREVLRCEMALELPEDLAAAKHALLGLAAATAGNAGPATATGTAVSQAAAAATGAAVLAAETAAVDFIRRHGGRLTLLGNREWTSAPASGSGAPARMVICPCSMGTLAAVANGLSNNLIERAADVALKEGHRLIVVPREMPMSTLHLENLTRLSRYGAVVMPAAPAFYQRPARLQDLVDFVVDRILAQLGLPGLLPAWGASPPA